VVRKSVKPLIALFFLTPLAHQQPLAFQAPQQRIERAFVDLEAVLRERLAECVAVMLLPQLRQYSQREAAATKFKAKVFEDVFCQGHAVPHTLYINYCISHSVCRQVYSLRRSDRPSAARPLLAVNLGGKR